MDKFFEMINQRFKALRRKYKVLLNFGICCRELGAQSYEFLRMLSQFLPALSGRYEIHRPILPNHFQLVK